MGRAEHMKVARYHAQGYFFIDDLGYVFKILHRRLCVRLGNKRPGRGIETVLDKIPLHIPRFGIVRVLAVAARDDERNIRMVDALEY